MLPPAKHYLRHMIPLCHHTSPLPKMTGDRQSCNLETKVSGLQVHCTSPWSQDLASKGWGMVAAFSLSKSGTVVWSGAPSRRASGDDTPENFWNSVCDLVHFCVIWWQLFVGCQTRYICNSAIKIEPICQLPCPHDCTAVLSVLSDEHALKSGTFGIPGMVLLGRGTTWHKSGTSR